MFTMQFVVCLLVVSATAHLLPRKGDNATDCGSREIREITVDREAVSSEQPWFIAIYHRESDLEDWDHRTEGTLITTKHAISDAYRVTDAKGAALPVTSLRLLAGKHLFDFDVTEPNSQSRHVTSLLVHEDYNDTSLVHDISLLVADEPFVLNWDVNIACVDWSGLLQAPTPGQRVLASGSRDGFFSSSWVFATPTAAIVSHEECRKAANEESLVYLSSDNLCVKATSNGTCTSLDGTGLLVERPTARGARFFLVGVWRFGLAWTLDRSCNRNVLSSYTSVGSYISWIERQMNVHTQ